MKKNALIILAVAFLIMVGSIAFYGTKPADAAGGGEMLRITKATVASSTLVTTASTRVMATSTSRTYADICNDSTGVIFLNFGNNASSDNGIRVNAGACYEIAGGNVVTTAINAAASSTPALVSFIEVAGYQGTYGN